MLEQRERILSQLNEIDDRFLTDLFSMLPDDERMVEREAVLRERRRNRANTFPVSIPLADTDLIDHVLDVCEDLEQIPAECWPLFDQYSRAITPVFENHLEERFDKTVEYMAMLFRVRVLNFGDAVYDEGPEKTAQVEEMRPRQLAISKERHEIEKKIQRVNKQYFVTFSRALLPETARRFEASVRNDAYRALANPLDPRPVVDEALAKLDISEEDETRLNSFITPFLTAYEETTRAMERRREEYLDEIEPMMPYYHGNSSEYKEEMQSLQERRDASSVAAISALKQFFPEAALNNLRTYAKYQQFLQMRGGKPLQPPG